MRNEMKWDEKFSNVQKMVTDQVDVQKSSPLTCNHGPVFMLDKYNFQSQVHLLNLKKHWYYKCVPPDFFSNSIHCFILYIFKQYQYF